MSYNVVQKGITTCVSVSLSNAYAIARKLHDRNGLTVRVMEGNREVMIIMNRRKSHEPAT